MDVVERVADIIRRSCEEQECYLAGAEDTARVAIAVIADYLEEFGNHPHGGAANCPRCQVAEELRGIATPPTHP